MNRPNIEILLVEDDEVDIKNVQRAFKKVQIGNPLHVARDGVEALEMLRGTGRDKLQPMPRIVLLDINMPRMNGIEFLQELRADEQLRSLSVFVMTTSDDDRDKVAAYDLNVAGYVLKPVEWSSFVEAVSCLGMYWSLIEMPGRFQAAS